VRKLLSWLLTGLIATAIAISFKSNVWVLASLALLIMLPASVITLKVVQRNSLEANENEHQKVAVIEGTGEQNLRNTTIERMRTEANQLQAEYGRIKKLDDKFEVLRRTVHWKMKADTHYKLYAEFYDHIEDYTDDVQFELKSIAALSGRDLE